MKYLKALPIFVIPLTLISCGGGSSTSVSTGGGGGGSSVTYGSVTASSVGSVSSPVYIGSRNAVFTGVFGAGFSSVTVKYPSVSSLTESEALALTDIAVDYGGAPIIYNYATGQTRAPLGRPYYANSSTPSISGQGNRFAYVRYDGANFRVHSVNIDGTDDRIVSPAGSSGLNPSYSPDGNYILFSQYETSTSRTRIYKVGALGGTPTVLTPNTDNATNPTWDPDGSQILFFRQINASGNYVPSAMTPTGGSIQSLAAGLNVQSPTGIAHMRSSPLYFESGYLSSNYYLWMFDPASGGISVSYSTDSIGSISPSPVPLKLAVARGGTSGGIFVRNVATGTESQILGAGYNSPSWGGIPASRVAVGTSGALTTANVGGFMFGQTGSGLVTAFISFDANTRSSLAIDKQTDSNPSQSVAVCTISGDSLKSLIYSNDLKGAPNVVATAATPIKGAVVSFGADSGHVIAVVPFTQSAAVKSDATGFKFTGHFLAPYDEAGKTRSVGGGTSLTLDSKTGQVVLLK